MFRKQKNHIRWIGVVIIASAVLVTANSIDYINCRVSLANSEYQIGVEILPNQGQSNTVWDLGSVPLGGVASTWYDGGPGYFVAHHIGDIRQKCKVVCDVLNMYHTGSNLYAQASLPTTTNFALAVAINSTDNVPDWQLLKYVDTGGSVYEYISYDMLPGSYVPFDLQFYAPQNFPTGGTNYKFGVMIEAELP